MHIQSYECKNNKKSLNENPTIPNGSKRDIDEANTQRHRKTLFTSQVINYKLG